MPVFYLKIHHPLRSLLLVSGSLRWPCDASKIRRSIQKTATIASAKLLQLSFFKNRRSQDSRQDLAFGGLLRNFKKNSIRKKNWSENERYNFWLAVLLHLIDTHRPVAYRLPIGDAMWDRRTYCRRRRRLHRKQFGNNCWRSFRRGWMERSTWRQRSMVLHLKKIHHIYSSRQ